MRVLTWILGAFAVVYWVAFLLVAFVVLLVFWQLLRPFVQGERRASVRDAKPIEEVRLRPGCDGVPEGLGVARRPSPHELEPRRTTPLAYLEEWEWRLWGEVIQRRGVRDG